MRSLSPPCLAGVPLSVLLILGCGGAGSPDASHDQNSSAIQGGTLDTGDAAVGLVWNTVHSELCTGTLITPSIVLTAAHCVRDADFSQMQFFTGTGSGGPSSSYNPNYDPSLTPRPVAQLQVAPGYTPGLCPNSVNDAALLQLGAPIYRTSRGVVTANPSIPAVGTAVTVVGFGWSNIGGPVGQKYSGTSVVAGSGPGYLSVNPSAAIADKGDSGGPLFWGSQVAGITMCHNDGDYPAHRVEYYQRVDVLSSWIQSTVNSWEQPCVDSCTNDYNLCTADGPNCFCLADEFNCLRWSCGKHEPVISCFWW